MTKEFSIKTVNSDDVYINVEVKYPNQKVKLFRFMKSEDKNPTQDEIEECKFLALNEAQANF